MPAFSSFQSTSLASVPEDDLLQKQRSIRRTRRDNRSWSPSSIHSLQQHQHDTPRSHARTRSDTGKRRDTAEMTRAGEWVVNVSDMDAGLISYAEGDRAILVLGDMPLATRLIIQSSGNYPNTLFIVASRLPGEATTDGLGRVINEYGGFTSPALSSQSSIATSISANTDRVERQAEFIQLPCSAESDATSNLVDGYRSVINEAQKAAAKWRSSRRSSTAFTSTYDAERQRVSPNIATTSPNGAQPPPKSRSFSKSLSFNILPSTRRSSGDKGNGLETLNSIIVYLPISRTPDPEICLQASLRHACAATTAIGPLLSGIQLPSGATGSPEPNVHEVGSSLHTSLLYVLPERHPANLPRAMQSYLTSDPHIQAPSKTHFQCFVLGNKTLDRKMQRQDDRRPITGLEIVMSGGMKWQERNSSPVPSLNLYLDDFRQCRFVSTPRAEDFDSSSANASYSSLTNSNTTDEEPLTPKLSREEDSIVANETIDDDDTKSTASYGPSLSSRIRRQSKTSSITSTKKTHFFRRLFANDQA